MLKYNEAAESSCTIKTLITNAEDNSKQKWLSLPTSSEKFTEALNEINVSSKNQDNIKIIEIDSKINRINDFIPLSSDINEINYLAANLLKLDDFDTKDFEILIQLRVPDNDIKSLINLSLNIDNYVVEYMPVNMNSPDLVDCVDIDFETGEVLIDYDSLPVDLYDYYHIGTITEQYDGVNIPDEFMILKNSPETNKEWAIKPESTKSSLLDKLKEKIFESDKEFIKNLPAKISSLEL